MAKDHRVEQLENLTDLLKTLKKDKDKGKVTVSDVLSEDLLDPGVYAYNDGSGIQVVEFKKAKDTLELAHALKEKNLSAPVKLTNQQVTAVRNLVKFHKDNGGFNWSAEAIAEHTESDTIGNVPVELRAAASASAEFKASWTSIQGQVELKAGVGVTFGKEGGFQYTAALEAVAAAKVKIGLTGIKGSAEATAEASHELKFGKLKVGNTDYSLGFYANLKGFVTAKAEFALGLGGVKTGAFAGFGVAGEVGVQILGKYGVGAIGLKERALAIVAGVFEVKVGVGGEIEARYTSEDTVIDGSAYTQHSLSVELTFLTGASLNFKFSLLKELEEALKEKVLKAVTDKIKAIVGQELYDYWVRRYNEFKEELFSGIGTKWSEISARINELIGRGDKYSTIHDRLQSYHVKLNEAIVKAQQSGNQEMVTKMNEVRNKLTTYLDGHNDLPSRLRRDIQTIASTVGTIAGSGDVAKAVADNLSQIEEIIKISEDLIEVKISFIEATRELGVTLNEKNANALINEMLDLQDEIRGTIDAITFALKEVIMTYKS